MARKFELSNTSLNKINTFLDSIENDINDPLFFDEFMNVVKKDVKMIKDCSETSIVDFYIETCKQLLDKYEYEIYESFYDDLKHLTRHKLADKYVSKEMFDNNIDIYFNEVKREYILHPMGESEEMAFVPENRDVFIKNNLKLVINCAKRYQNLGLPLDDLIQAGNEGLLIAFEKFDSDRANLRYAIINDIDASSYEFFSRNDAEELIRNNFKYTKTLDATLSKLPDDGFKSKKEFKDWTIENIKKASFSSIGFAWIRAMILCQINKLGKIIKVPKNSKELISPSISIIRLDSTNPHTDDCYHDNQISEVVNEEFLLEDEFIENMEKQNLFKKAIEKSLSKLPVLDRRILKKKFGLDLPFPMSINEISENEGISTNKVKYSITSSLKFIEKNMNDEDKKIIKSLLK